MKTVFLAIPNFVASGDLLRTEYLKYLSQKYRVVVLAPFLDPEAATHLNYYKTPTIVYVRKNLENPNFWIFFKLLRISLVNEFDYLRSLQHWYKRPNYLKNRKRRILRFFGRPFSRFLTANFFTKLESWLLPKSKSFFELANQYHPDHLIVSTPGFDSWEAELITFAKRLKLTTVAVDFSWDNLTTNAKHIRKTDFLIAWNTIMKKEAETIHKYSPDKVFVSGAPRFDPYFIEDKNNPGRDTFLKSKGLNPDYKTIFHTTVTKAYPFQKKYIRDLISLRDARKIPYVNFFIRIHPLDIYENYQEFFNVPDLCIERAGKNFDGETEMNIDDLFNLKRSLEYTDLNINYASTISIEACVFNKPIINIGFIDRFALAYDFEHYRPIFQSGAIRLAKEDADLPKFINMYLENPSLDSEAREWVVHNYAEFTDGQSYRRSVDLIEKCRL